ncbi:hypothetical protein M1437_01885 [Patescibacteria group bacterium]|nr:hypothetical protein [Patescibacteria group bacterium]
MKMNSLNKQKVALIFAVFGGGWHLLWSLLVLLKVAQGILDFIYRIHMLNNPFRVSPFNPTTAILLIIVTTALGYGMGWVFAALWNKLHNG